MIFFPVYLMYSLLPAQEYTLVTLLVHIYNFLLEELILPNVYQMIIVDTPGTNVILQRQQRLTEEFVPRADLLLFVISADRPLTESEV